MSKPSDYEQKLAIGIVQTKVDAGLAWEAGGKQPKMTAIQDDYVWMQLRKALRSFQNAGLKPKFIVFPELSLPRTRMAEFGRLVSALNVIAFIGADYHLDRKKMIAENQGVVFIPRGFFRGHPSRYCSRLVFGKSYAAPKEKKKLKELIPPWSFHGDHKVYVFDCAKYGRVGVSICYDFMDIERALMYRGKIQHLFVLAYNRDLGMFRSLADSLSRTVFCNVVICNTGHYGGSLAVSPYYHAYNRALYSHEGKDLFTTQVVELPLRKLVRAQQEKQEQLSAGETQEFKDPPPGFKDRALLKLKKEKLE